MRPWYVIGGAVIVVVALVVIFHEPDEDAGAQVRRTLDEAVEAAEKKDMGALMDKVSHQFRGQGGTDRNGIKGILFVYLQRGDWTRVFLVDPIIEIDPDQLGARVRTAAVLASGENLESVTDVGANRATTYDFDMRLACEEDGEWRVITATYEPARLSNIIDRLSK